MVDRHWSVGYLNEKAQEAAVAAGKSPDYFTVRLSEGGWYDIWWEGKAGVKSAIFREVESFFQGVKAVGK